MERVNFVREFIEVYRSCPCLWRVKSPEYCNQRLKAESYAKLVKIAQKHFPHHRVDAKYVKGKIQNMRSVYRKELNKVERSKISGAGEVYVPSLWYFHLLDFTKDQEVERPSVTTAAIKFVDPIQDAKAQEAKAQEAKAQDAKAQDAKCALDTRTMKESSHTNSIVHPPPLVIERPRKKAKGEDPRISNLLDSAMEVLLNPHDEHYFWGMSLASRARGMTPELRAHYKRIVGELDMLCDLGMVNGETRVTNDRPSVTPPATPSFRNHCEIRNTSFQGPRH